MTREPRIYIGCHIILSVILFVATAGIVWAYRLFKNYSDDFVSLTEINSPKAKLWYNMQIADIYSTKWTVIFGVISAVLVAITAQFVISLWHSTLLLRLYSFAWYTFCGFWCGAVVYPIIMATYLPSRLARSHLSVALYQPPGCGLRALGFILFQMAVISALNYGLIVLGLLTSPLYINWFIFGGIGIGGIILMIWFFVPQYVIHRMLWEVKRRHLMKLAPYSNQIYREAIEKPSFRNVEHLGKVTAMQRTLEQLPEWPFDMRKLVVLVSSILIPMAGVLLDLLLR